MQESLEDYIKIVRNSRQDDSVKISKEMVVTAQLKKECDARAMKIVEFSIEGRLRPEVLTKCLPFINQSHYQDIVEERSITKLCGYSICGKRIPEMPKKQYLISTKSNKVYDITERKNFCSNFCYKASLHIKKQIDDSPLWLRKLENIPEYKLLHTSEGGLPGDYIDQGVVKPVQEYQFASIASFTQASLDDLNRKEPKPDKRKNSKSNAYMKPSKLKSTMQTIKETEVEEETQVISTLSIKENIEEKKSISIVRKDVHHKKHCVVSLPSIEEQEIEVNENLQALRIEPTEVKAVSRTAPGPVKQEAASETNKLTKNKGERHKARKVSKKKQKENPRSNADIQGFIKKLLADWLTLETCIFIHGEARVKGILNEKKLGDLFERLDVARLQREQQQKYMEICKRLHLQEMADEKFDKAMTGGHRLKPLPDYKRLKSDTKEMQLKVRSFYEGGMFERDDANFPDKRQQEHDKEDEQGPPAVLPPVDVNSQHLLRRKIFLTSLNKVMQQLLQGLGIPTIMSVLSDIQNMVKTFTLRADNITFKPPVWNIIALALLHLLSVRDTSIRQILEHSRSRDYIDSFVGYVSEKEMLKDLADDASKVEEFVEQYITRSESATM